MIMRRLPSNSRLKLGRSECLAFDLVSRSVGPHCNELQVCVARIPTTSTYLTAGGASGSGKAVVLNVLLAQLLKSRPRMVVFDKDRGCELFVRAAGGKLLALKNGQPTGCAPLKALGIDDGSIVWLARWVEWLAGGEFTPQDRAAIPRAIKALQVISKPERDIGGLRANFRRHRRARPLGAAPPLAAWSAARLTISTTDQPIACQPSHPCGTAYLWRLQPMGLGRRRSNRKGIWMLSRLACAMAVSRFRACPIGRRRGPAMATS